MNDRKYAIIASILVLILLSLFLFRYDLEAMYKGVDVKYIEDPLYCEQDSDCVVQGNNCVVVNTLHFEESWSGCEQVTCGSVCRNNHCKFKGCEVRLE